MKHGQKAVIIGESKAFVQSVAVLLSVEAMNKRSAGGVSVVTPKYFLFGGFCGRK